MSAGITGIAVTDECMAAFDELKKKKIHRYIVFSIQGPAVALEAKGERGTTYQQFVEWLPKDKPAYIVFDYEYPKDGVNVSKLLFISWIPDIANVRQKMMYAGTKDSLKAKIEGGLIEVQATDLSDIAPETILAKVAK